MYQNYSSASSFGKNNFLWIGQPGNTFIDSSIPIEVPSTAIGIFYVIHGAGGNGGNGATSNGSSSYSGGAGGGSGSFLTGLFPCLLIPKILYIVTTSATNQIWLSITPNPGTVTQMGLAVCGSGGTGGNGAVGATSTAGAAGVAVANFLDLGVNNGQSPTGSSGRTGLSGAAGTDFNWSSSNPVASIGPSGGGMAATTTFVGGGASALATLRTYINTQAGGAAGSAGSNGQSIFGLNNILLGGSGSGGGSTNGGVGGAGGQSMLGSGGAGGGTGTAGGGAGSLGGPPFVFIQFW